MEVNLNIEKKDIKYIKEYLGGKAHPVDLEEITNRIALFKTQDIRSHKVKIYDPECEYKVGDFIFKEYPGKIPIGAKKNIEIDHGVVLLVTDVRNRFGIDEVILSYEGTSDFKKYISYLERQKIDLLLPHKQEKPPTKPEYLSPEMDPRAQQAPLERKDYKLLKKKIIAALNKEHDISFINGKMLLESNLKELSDEVFKKIKSHLNEKQHSETTEFFIENFAGIKPDSEEFDAYCFSLNYKMSIDYKIDFQQTRFEGWGKWNLISVIYYTKMNSMISDTNPLLYQITLANKKGLAQKRRKFEDNLFAEGNTRFFLTQREIVSGAVKIRSGLFDFGDAIEVELLEGKSKKTHLIYYYSDDNLLLGFKEIFKKSKALQGTLVTFEKTSDGRWSFSIRTTKKGTIGDKLVFDEQKKAFRATEEKVASPVFVNKSMFLERDVFDKLYERIDQYRRITTMNELVHKICLEFGIKEKNYEIHILRLYHILDLVFPVDLKTVIEVILGNNEFIASEKIPGVFYLDSSTLPEIEEEEQQRVTLELDETRKKRDEVKRVKQEEEQKLKDEIKRKREERRKKREEEMWQKERMKIERGEQVNYDVEGIRNGSVEEPQELPMDVSETPQYVEPAYQEPAPVEEQQPEPVPQREVEDTQAKEHHKKGKRKTEEEKPKAGKRAPKRHVEDKMSEDDIKDEIQLAELKEQLMEKKEVEKKKKKKKEVAYKDEASGGAFGGVFASKLDEIVKKDSEEE